MSPRHRQLPSTPQPTIWPNQPQPATIEQMLNYRRLFDQYAGVIVAVIFAIIIGGFIIVAHPFDQPAPASQAKPSPTPGVATTIHGQATFKCPQPDNCPDDFSAYDVAAYTSTTSSSAIAQGQIDQTGAFQLHLPSGVYYLKTVPATSPAIKIEANLHTPSINLVISP